MKGVRAGILTWGASTRMASASNSTVPNFMKVDK